MAAPEGQSQLLQQDIYIVAYTMCHSCYVLHDFPFHDWLLHTLPFLLKETKTSIRQIEKSAEESQAQALMILLGRC